MFTSSFNTPELKNRGKRKWSNQNLRHEQEFAVTDNLQPQSKRARRGENLQEARTPLGKVASWVRETARKTVRIFTSFRDIFWRDEVGDQDTNENSPPVYKNTDMRQHRQLDKSLQDEVRRTQVQEEATSSNWRRKPLEENFSQYRLYEPSSSRRSGYNPSKYRSAKRDEFWPPPSSSPHREVSDEEVVTRSPEAKDMKPKTSNSYEKRRNISAFRTKRHLTTVDNVVRLQEREQYMKLLAHYTSSSQPKYNSVSKNAIVVDDDDHKETNVTSKRNLQMEHSVFSSEPQFPNPRLPTDVKESRQSVKVRASPLKMSSVAAETSRTVSASDSKGILELKPNNRPSRRSYDLLDDSWIKKWRETLSTDHLEHERKIAKEKLKLEAIRKQKGDVGLVSEQVRKRMEGKQERPMIEEEAVTFQVLTDQMDDVIDKALGHGAPNELLVEMPRITRGDIITLRPQTWLNDEVVNAYLHMIAERSKNSQPKVHAFNTFFYPKLIKTGHASLRRWTKKVDLFAMDIILVPVHLGMHWCLAVIDLKRKTFTYYDSLKGENQQCIRAVRDYMCAESLDKKKTNLDLTGWKNDSPKNIPEQLNGCDCGVFACTYAEYVSRRAVFNFTQHDMPYFRRRMVYEILKKKLL